MQNDNKNNDDILFRFCCQHCHYKTCKKSSYNNHLSSKKHKKAETSSTNVTVHSFVCEYCKKNYKDQSGLWSHKKKCSLKTHHEPDFKVDMKDIITPEQVIEIIKQNSEFKELLLQQNSKLLEISSISPSVTHNTNNSHSHNKTFNMQVFLNETCKDAMNMKDFIDSIQLQLSDFENIGSQGYINGISNIIIKNLKALDENMRPVHCSDVKRESIYVKDQNKWEKDTEDNKKIKSLIKQIAQKNVKMIPKYREEYPDSQYGYSKRSDIYSRAIIEAMGGPGDDDEAKANKIVKRIAREILIDKQQQLQLQPQL